MGSNRTHVVFELGSEKKANEEPSSSHSVVEGTPGVYLWSHLLLLGFPCDLSPNNSERTL